MTQPASSERPGDVAEASHPPRPSRADLALAAAYAGFVIGYTLLVLRSNVPYLPWVAGSGPGSITVDVRLELVSLGSFVLVLICAVALAWRRARPERSFLAICAVGLVQAVIGEPISAWNIAMVISLFSAAAYAERRFARLVLAVATLAYIGLWVLDAAITGQPFSLPDLPGLLLSGRVAVFTSLFAVLLGVWVVGDQVRASRERTKARLERAAQLEREREATARIGAMAERQRIARELHDVVAHGLAVMIVQADGARYAEAEHPEVPRQALATIAATGRESLTEMRRLLGVLRDDPDAAQLAPEPELASIPELIERYREAGLEVDYQVEGATRAVQPGVGLTAYRVVQESLTNVLHHVGSTRVDVRVTFRPYAIGLVVSNDPGSRPGAPSSDDREGLGLIGMRERVVLHGGTMAAGPDSAGGFTVEVEIPDGTLLLTGAPA